MPARCFISYARQNNDPYLERFFQDLREEIVLREGVTKEEAVFLDVRIPTGADWESDIGRALMESLACVTIYTPSYFKRDYCGKEFQVFLDRAGVAYDEEGAAVDARCIFPILWSREKDLRSKGLPPRVARRITYTGKAQHDRYVEVGLRHILRRDPQGLYLDLLQEMANDLVDEAFANAPPPLPGRPSFDGTRNPFSEPPEPQAEGDGAPAVSPVHLPFFLLTDPASTGAFSLPELKPSLEDLEEEFTLRVEAAYPGTEPPLRVAEALAEAASNNAQAIVIVDPHLRSSAGGALRDFLSALLAVDSWQGALLLPVDDAADTSAIQDLLGEEFSTPETVVVETVSTASDQFAAGLRRVVLGLVKRLVEEGELRRSLPEGGEPGQRPQIHGPYKQGSRA